MVERGKKKLRENNNSNLGWDIDLILLCLSYIDFLI